LHVLALTLGKLCPWPVAIPGSFQDLGENSVLKFKPECHCGRSRCALTGQRDDEVHQC
jgi:hypothetical protein